MKKILLIEDNQDVRENTAEILKLAQYNVVTANNGKEGVELVLKEKPDLIICDIMMPVLDGHGVLHLLSRFWIMIVAVDCSCKAILSRAKTNVRPDCQDQRDRASTEQSAVDFLPLVSRWIAPTASTKHLPRQVRRQSRS